VLPASQFFVILSSKPPEKTLMSDIDETLDL